MVEATISKWGNSEGIRIPKEIRDRIGLHEGSRVSIDVEGDRIIITPPRSHATQVGRYSVPNLRDLFAEYHGNYQPTEDGFAAPVGKEEL